MAETEVIEFERIMPVKQSDTPSSATAPGVYVRSANKTSDIDALWSGSRTYFRDDRSGLFTLLFGFLLGAAVTSVLFLTVFNQPVFTQLWTPAVSSQAVANPVAGDPGVTGPTLKPLHQVVVVEKGETLSEIVDREYRNTAPHIQQRVSQVNNLGLSHNVMVGQRLTLPTIP
jgi:LysM repeat protein